jgi:hypothetical protein
VADADEANIGRELVKLLDPAAVAGVSNVGADIVLDNWGRTGRC